MDNETHKPKSIVRIIETDGVVTGTVERIFDPAKQDAKCDACANDDARKGKPFIGMAILTGLKKSGTGKYAGGRILDPDNGKTYDATVTVIEQGKKLQMRGSVAFMGRTETWSRSE